MSIQEWISRHMQPVGQLSGSELAPVTITSNQPNTQSQTFYFYYKGIYNNIHNMIFGYCVVRGKLLARAWYKSNSEGYWRCFLGLVRQRPTSNATFLKGAVYSGSEEQQRFANMGYMYETMVTFHLNDQLNIFWGAQERTNDIELNNEILFSSACSQLQITLPTLTLAQFSCLKLSEDYVSEHKHTMVFLPKNVSPIVSNLLQIHDSIKMQTDYASQPISPDSIGPEHRTGIGHQIKHDENLWNWIISALENKIIPPSAPWTHPVLHQNCITQPYRLLSPKDPSRPWKPPLDALIIEISQTTTPQPFRYGQEPVENMQTVNTFYCWINNVYWEHANVTSFGNYNFTPINFAFLVQKPIDYLDQVSDYYKEKQLGLGIFRKPEDPIIEGRYVPTALLNEALNPLIQAFKNINNLPRFRKKYYQKIYSDEQRFLLSIKRQIVTYLDLALNSGFRDSALVNEFKNQIQLAGDINAIPPIIDHFKARAPKKTTLPWLKKAYEKTCREWSKLCHDIEESVTNLIIMQQQTPPSV